MISEGDPIFLANFGEKKALFCDENVESASGKERIDAERRKGVFGGLFLKDPGIVKISCGFVRNRVTEVGLYILSIYYNVNSR